MENSIGSVIIEILNYRQKNLIIELIGRGGDFFSWEDGGTVAQNSYKHSQDL